MRERGIARKLIALCVLGAALGCANRAGAHAAGTYGIGRPASAAETAALDIDIAVDGSGLPSGRGTAQDGATIYAASCRSCHGERIDLRRWSHPTALFDYVRRAMPPQGPRLLSANDTYAISTFLLYTNGRVGAHEIVDRDALVRLGRP